MMSQRHALRETSELPRYVNHFIISHTKSGKR
jgi:hypothetical protein